MAEDKEFNLEEEISSLQNDDLVLKEILNEAKALQEEVVEEALKAKDKVKEDTSEIFSNKSKEPRLISSNPLDLDQPQKSRAEVEQEEKLLKQLEIQRTAKIAQQNPNNPSESLHTNTDDLSISQPEGPYKNLLRSSNAFGSGGGEKFDSQGIQAKKISHLNEKVRRLHGIHTLETINIDISDKKDDSAKFSLEIFDATKESAEDVSHYEKFFGKPKPANTEAQAVINRVPNYRPALKTGKLSVTAGKFSEIVKEEYMEYVKSVDPLISQSNELPEDQVDISAIAGMKKPSLSNAVTVFFSSDENSLPQSEKAAVVEDFKSPRDAKNIWQEMKQNKQKLNIRCTVVGFCCFISVFFTILQGISAESIAKASPGFALIFAIINLFTLLISAFACNVVIINGLSPLAKLKGNSDTALAVAAIASFLQSCAALFSPNVFFSGTLNIFSSIVIIGFLLNSLGKLFILQRVRGNFKFIIDKGRKFAVKIFSNDSRTAGKLVSGTAAVKPLIAYQHRTEHLGNFLKLSYAPDLSEEMTGKIAPISIICSLILTVIYAILNHDFFGILTFFALLTAISIPLCGIVSTNIPMLRETKKLLKSQAMLAGYPAVKQFADSAAIMVSAQELYPKESVVLEGVKKLVSYKIDDKMLLAAAAMKESNHPLCPIFNNFLNDNKSALPEVESVIYEEKMGLIAWVNGERILLGGRKLLQKFGIVPPEQSVEEKYKVGGRDITYFAHAGEIIAILVTTYKINQSIRKDLIEAQKAGLSFLVATNDYNITMEKVGDDFGLFYRSIKILSPGLSTACDEVTSVKEQSSRAYLATRGKFSSMLRGVTSCLRINGIFSLSVVIQLLGVIIGFVLCSVIALSSGGEITGAVGFLIYSVFWVAASIIAPILKR